MIPRIWLGFAVLAVGVLAQGDTPTIEFDCTDTPGMSSRQL